MLNKFFKIFLIAIAFAYYTSAVKAEDTIKIAIIEPMSGPLASVGLDLIEGLEFYAERINKAGGVLGGKHIEIVPYDNAMVAEKTIQQLRKVIDEDIRYVTQGVGSNHALNIIKTLGKHNKRNPGKEIMFLNHSAVTTSFTNELCNFYHFRFDANVDMKVAALVSQMTKDPSIKKVYLLNQNYAYGQSFQAAARRLLAERAPQIEIVGDELIVPFGKILDFNPYVSKITSSGADTVLTGNWGPDAARLITATANSQLKVKFYTIYAGIPAAMNSMGVKISTFNPIVQVTEAHENDPSHPDWLKEIDAEYMAFSNKSPYADRQRFMMEMFAAALEKAGTADPTAVAWAMEGMTARGAHGDVYMRPEDHQMHFDMVLSHISTDVEKTFIYNNEDYGMAYVTDGWVNMADITLPTTCKMKRPKK
ncbi:MAG: Leucine-, isoleucine-, valine-, threonine-, and alanine-binding protein [Alphaproteobacteria bacterium MarineAlpha9_Bin3]|nr:MAG: Leucine-, isoleucine-, valine-, threonine-, and alanine-binding protein [Alphaproteobacteria bacterium MarineAlpha9_Bin3]